MEDLRLLWITVPIYVVILIGALAARDSVGDAEPIELARADFRIFASASLPEMPTLAPLDASDEVSSERIITHGDLEGSWLVTWRRFDGERCVEEIKGRAESRFAHQRRWFVTRFTWDQARDDLPGWSAVGFDRERGDYVSVRIDGERGTPVIGRGQIVDGRLTTRTGSDAHVPGFERSLFTQRGTRSLQRVETLSRGTDAQGYRAVWRIDYRKP